MKDGNEIGVGCFTPPKTAAEYMLDETDPKAACQLYARQGLLLWLALGQVAAATGPLRRRRHIQSSRNVCYGL